MESARTSGALRADIDAHEVLALTCGVRSVAGLGSTKAKQRALADRYAEVLLDGLFTRPR
jgi:hypothetical protein